MGKQRQQQQQTQASSSSSSLKTKAAHLVSDLTTVILNPISDSNSKSSVIVSIFHFSWFLLLGLFFDEIPSSWLWCFSCIMGSFGLWKFCVLCFMFIGPFYFCFLGFLMIRIRSSFGSWPFLILCYATFISIEKKYDLLLG